MKQKSFFLLAMLLVAFAGNAQNSSDFDHNGDGAVDLSDVSILIDYILNPPGFANQTFTVKGVNFDMIAVEGGTFTMGATEERGQQGSDPLLRKGRYAPPRCGRLGQCERRVGVGK